MKTKSKMPFVYTNLAISIDGKIATAKREHSDPSPDDRKQMQILRRNADVVLFGANTLRAFQRPVLCSGGSHSRWRKTHGRVGAHPINMVLAQNLDFETDWPFFRDRRIQRVIAVPEKSSHRRIARYLPFAEILYLKTGSPVPLQILEWIRHVQLQTLLIEGGGGILFPWAKENLIDEWNVTISPKVIGGQDAPTMVEGEGFSLEDIQNLKLLSCRRAKNDIFLRYRPQRPVKKLKETVAAVPKSFQAMQETADRRSNLSTGSD